MNNSNFWQVRPQLLLVLKSVKIHSLPNQLLNKQQGSETKFLKKNHKINGCAEVLKE